MKLLKLGDDIRLDLALRQLEHIGGILGEGLQVCVQNVGLAILPQHQFGQEQGVNETGDLHSCGFLLDRPFQTKEGPGQRGLFHQIFFPTEKSVCKQLAFLKVLQTCRCRNHTSTLSIQVQVSTVNGKFTAFVFCLSVCLPQVAPGTQPKSISQSHKHNSKLTSS